MEFHWQKSSIKSQTTYKGIVMSNLDLSQITCTKEDLITKSDLTAGLKFQERCCSTYVLTSPAAAVKGSLSNKFVSSTVRVAAKFHEKKSANKQQVKFLESYLSSAASQLSSTKVNSFRHSLTCRKPEITRPSLSYTKEEEANNVGTALKTNTEPQNLPRKMMITLPMAKKKIETQMPLMSSNLRPTTLFNHTWQQRSKLKSKFQHQSTSPAGTTQLNQPRPASYDLDNILEMFQDPNVDDRTNTLLTPRLTNMIKAAKTVPSISPDELSPHPVQKEPSPLESINVADKDHKSSKSQRTNKSPRSSKRFVQPGRIVQPLLYIKDGRTEPITSDLLVVKMNPDCNHQDNDVYNSSLLFHNKGTIVDGNQYLPVQVRNKSYQKLLRTPLFISGGKGKDERFGGVSQRVLNQRGSQALGPQVIAVSIDDFARARQAKLQHLQASSGQNMMVGVKIVTHEHASVMENPHFLQNAQSEAGQQQSTNLQYSHPSLVLQQAKSQKNYSTIVSSDSGNFAIKDHQQWNSRFQPKTQRKIVKPNSFRAQVTKQYRFLKKTEDALKNAQDVEALQQQPPPGPTFVYTKVRAQSCYGTKRIAKPGPYSPQSAPFVNECIQITRQQSSLPRQKDIMIGLQKELNKLNSQKEVACQVFNSAEAPFDIPFASLTSMNLNRDVLTFEPTEDSPKGTPANRSTARMQTSMLDYINQESYDSAPKQTFSLIKPCPSKRSVISPIRESTTSPRTPVNLNSFQLVPIEELAGNGEIKMLSIDSQQGEIEAHKDKSLQQQQRAQSAVIRYQQFKKRQKLSYGRNPVYKKICNTENAAGTVVAAPKTVNMTMNVQQQQDLMTRTYRTNKQNSSEYNNSAEIQQNESFLCDTASQGGLMVMLDPTFFKKQQTRIKR